MYLINEELVRAHQRERIREADEARLAYGLIMARKARRKAGEATLRARRALASRLAV